MAWLWLKLRQAIALAVLCLIPWRTMASLCWALNRLAHRAAWWANDLDGMADARGNVLRHLHNPAA